MCGICGVLSSNVSQSERDLAVGKMNLSIIHRGPDDDGIYSDEYCTLAMRRLSIIDLSTGKQPIYSNCRRYLIFFNGEIYNYRELKSSLIKDSFTFLTNSDTEVVVNLYKRDGARMLEKLDGMFAFCIYDLETKKYFIARDRFGEKPFFYYYNSKNLIFSSEISSLLASNLFKPSLNRDFLGTYFRLGYVPEPNTLLMNVFSLPPSCFMEVNSDLTIAINQYAKIEYKPDNSIKSIDDAALFIKPFFENAVKKQMVSDVPVGAFLSGGIDSSSVVAMMAKFSSKPIQTFTVKFQTREYDESTIAKSVSEKIGSHHSEIVVENSQFKEEQFWRILKHVGLPFPDSSAIPTDIVTSEIAKHVKVALSGDGGDEVFGGYTVFDWVDKVHSVSKIPAFIRRPSKLFIEKINHSFFNSNKLRQISKVLNISGLPLSRLIQEVHALVDIDEANKLFTSELNDYAEFDAFNPLDTVLRNSMRYRIKYDLPLDMLVKVDRMSMANSLEVRCPFLDPLLFDASTKLPDIFLRDKGVGKVVIRKLMESELPAEVFNHPKSGFSIPLHDFRNNEFNSLAKKLLGADFMKELFQEEALSSILQSGLSESKDNASGSIYRKTHQLWSLMMFSGWVSMYNVEV